MDGSELLRLLTELVAIRSVNPMGLASATSDRACSREVATCLETWLHLQGVDCVRQELPCGEVNLIATVPGRPGGPTLVFDAHTDTVPAENWADRAFIPRLENGRLYGRGACDTKGSLAAMACALARTAREGTPPRTLMLLASAEEEYTRTGIRAFLAGHPPITYAIVGEPTCCQPVVACKGAARWDIVVRGRSAHTAWPHVGVNAIARMTRVIDLLGDYERTVLANRSHPLTDPPTVTVSLIRGGTAINVVPDSCRISVDLRTLPNEEPARAMQELQAFLADRCEFPLEHEVGQLWPGADAPPDHPFASHCLECTRQVLGESRPVRLQGVNYGCHASDYGTSGVPAVVLGPGDITLAHAVDEYVEIDDVHLAAEIYYRIMATPLTS